MILKNKAGSSKGVRKPVFYRYLTHITMIEKDEYGIPKFPKRPDTTGGDRMQAVNAFKAQAEKVAAEMRALTLKISQRRDEAA